MLNFDIWAIGLLIMAGLAIANVALLLWMFHERRWFSAILCILVSLFGWLLLLGSVFLEPTGTGR
jgi:hypothetical protein